MTLYTHDYIYCSPFFPVQSLDALLEDPESGIDDYPDPGETPEERVSSNLDHDRLHRWLGDLPVPLAAVAKLLMEGMNQAAIARQLRVSEAAISKRISLMREIGVRRLKMLRNSIILN